MSAVATTVRVLVWGPLLIGIVLPLYVLGVVAGLPLAVRWPR